MKWDTKFERVQWPVGHGGFHTGRFEGDGANFRYFFDCGAYSKEGKELISEKLAAVEFDFGVISHFDHDHYSELANVKKVKVLFLPYMTPIEMLLQALADQAQSAKKLTMDKAFQGFSLLQQLQANGTRIIMVDGSGIAPNDPPQGEPEELEGGISWRIPGVSIAHHGISKIRHEAAVEVLRDTTELLYFKFFNHRVEEASQEFASRLSEAVKAGLLKQEDKTAYTCVDDFLAAVVTGDAKVIRNNGRAMQTVYKEALGTDTLKVPRITGSNLSSLTMFNHSTHHWPSRHFYPNQTTLRAQGGRHEMSRDEDGWMLTGDLELTPETWPAFKDHYFHELSTCSVFNVPHHASAISLCEEASFFLASQFFVMPVNAGDDKHPSNTLTERLKRHGVSSLQSVTTAWESTVAVEQQSYLRRE